MTDCNCPVLPAFDELTAEELDQVTGSPLRCLSCGGVLELRCPEGHVHQAPRSHSPNVPRAARVDRRRVCASGHELPKGAKRCYTCQPRPERRSNRTYKAKPCRECRETFTPTGPRDDICTTCRGGVS